MTRVAAEERHCFPRRRDITKVLGCAVCELDPIIIQVLVPGWMVQWRSEDREHGAT